MAQRRAKAEHELAQSIKKAVSSEETAPKQKHVRVAAVFTWDYHTAQPVWEALKSQPVLSDEVQAFKALIVLHKVMRDGHPSVSFDRMLWQLCTYYTHIKKQALQQSIREIAFLDFLGRNGHINSHRGYASLIDAYIKYLKFKLEFHTIHPEFTANMDYKEYRALRKVVDPNEGYNTIMELMGQLEKIDSLQKIIFTNFRASSANECRISALVPLVEESYGIYKFIVSMLTAMHASVESNEALAPLREKFKNLHLTLSKFYQECSNLRYLTSLITVPQLSPIPPDFTSSEVSRTQDGSQTPRERTPPPEDIWGSVASMNQEPQWNISRSNSVDMLEQSQQLVLQQQQLIRNSSVENELMGLRQQNAYAQQMVVGYEGRIGEMSSKMQDYEHRIAAYEQQLINASNFNLNQEQRDREKDELIRILQEEVAMWKMKYENIAKMYAQLRKEHLDLLQKYQQMQQQSQAAKKAIAEKENLQTALKSKTAELAELVLERDRLKQQFDVVKQSSAGDIAKYKQEAEAAVARFENLSKTKGDETQRLVAQFNSEKEMQDLKFSSLLSEHTQLKSELGNLKPLLEKLESELNAKKEEIIVLQAGLDQSLIALQQLQQRGSDTEATLLSKMDNLSLEHRTRMDKIMDSVLEDCKTKCADSIFELENESNPGNKTATPEYVLSMTEKLVSLSNEFAASFTKHVIGASELSGDQQAQIIRDANNLAQSIMLLSSGSKGVTTLAGEESVKEKVINSVKTIVSSGKSFYHNLQSARISVLDFSQRPQAVQTYNLELQTTLTPLVKIVESLVPNEVSAVNIGDDLGDIVENELKGAAKIIEEAAAVLTRLLGEDRSADPKLTQTDLQVHQSILISAKAITDAIARLIICATHTQQEIVANGKGSGTKTAFYKKNSRWMEGLISAAKAVASATKILVECADGVVHGTHSMEQLLVAANEVAAATAQLVAASRVKAIRGSKTQDRLEGAAKAVTEATKLLVKAAEQSTKHSSQSQKIDVDFSKLTPHEFKKREMEQQVQIMTLEKKLTEARRTLADMRKVNYHKESDF